jgi:hypothetical protein
MMTLEPESATNLPPVLATVREAGELRLVVDPIALSALAAVQAAGISSPAALGQLPSLEDLPLCFVALEARVEVIERRLEQLERAERETRIYG